MREPNFSPDLRREDVFGAAHDAFNNREFLPKLRAEVERLSNGAMRLEDAGPGDVRGGLKGPGAFLVLVRGTERQSLTFGPYADPFTFCTRR
jgi:hypothetical protein